MADIINFHTNEDFKFKIGDEEKIIDVPRMVYRNAKIILETIGRYTAEERSFFLELLGKAKKADVLISEKNYNTFSEFLIKRIPELATKNLYYRITELLKIISNNILNDKIIEEMQYDEAVKILTFLLDKNFDSLKNLSASLQTIDMSEKK